jgi:hypothetical protein
MYTNTGAKDSYFDSSATLLNASANPPLDSITLGCGAQYVGHICARWKHAGDENGPEIVFTDHRLRGKRAPRNSKKRAREAAAREAAARAAAAEAALAQERAEARQEAADAGSPAKA